MWEEVTTIQRDLDRLENWANKNCMRFNKDKYEVLHLEWNNLKQQKRLGTDWLGYSSAAKDLGVLGDSKLNMSQQCTVAVKKAASLLDCIRRRTFSRSRHVLTLLNT